ncbi:MAG: hypothetical protein WC082_11740, partial [Victivallales bacterium]
SGYPEYWDHVERTLRNLLVKAQFTLTPEFSSLFKKSNQGKSHEEIQAALKALKNIEGGFVSQPTFNDWVGFPDNPRLGTPGRLSNGIHMMGCCPPEGMRAIWEAWNGIVETKPEGVFINMPISRDHEAAVVQAFRPEDGCIEVRAKIGGDFFIRPPAWSERAEWQLTVNDKNEEVYWGGPAQAYVVRRGVKKGDKLTVSWQALKFIQEMIPLSIRDSREKLTVHWAGNEVKKVLPRGKYLPMF